MKNIVVLDDDADAAELVSQALSGPDLRVRAFADPVRALALLDEEPIDLLIADLRMPWVDGAEVMATARMRRPDLPIIVVSGLTEGAQIAAASGVPFFAKPVDLGVLRVKVAMMLEAAAAPQTLDLSAGY